MRKIYRNFRNRLIHGWRLFWLERAGSSRFGRISAWIASANTAPYHQRAYLANLTSRGFISSSASITHPELRLGDHVYIGDKVVIFQTNGGGPVELLKGVHLYGDAFIETGSEGRVLIGDGTHIQPGCHIHAFLASIEIGKNVEIAPGCGFYCYDHGTAPGIPIMEQPLASKGGISVGDGAWIGYGVTVLQGVAIGDGAVIAAGSVVIRDIPANAIAAGVPAKVIKLRGDGASQISKSH